MVELSIRQQRFADEYVICGNATDAAIAAGYSEKYAGQNADKLLKNTKISSYIESRLNEIQSPKIADQQEVMEFLTALMRGEVEETVPLMQKKGGQILARTIPSAQTRKGAAEQIGKRYAMWTEKQEVDIKGAVQFVDDIGGDEDAT